MLKPEITKFRLGVAWPTPSDGASLSRIYGPFNQMMKTDPRFEIIQPKYESCQEGWQCSWSWDWLEMCDAVFIPHACSREHIAQIYFAKRAGAKVWVDYFDTMTGVRLSNPSAPAFRANRDGINANIAQIIAEADVVTVTTETLRQHFAELCVAQASTPAGAGERPAPGSGEAGSETLPEPAGETPALQYLNRILVIPESCRWGQFDLPRQKVVSWRGLCSHDEDLESVLPALHRVSHDPEFKDWTWFFIGEPTWKIAEGQYAVGTPETRLICPAKQPYQFMELWGKAAPYLHMVPMVDNAFNRCKTPLAWLEASAVGAAVIGPDLPEWRDCPGLIRYSREDREGGEGFESKLRAAMQSFREPPKDLPYAADEMMHENVRESRAAIYPARTLAEVNKLRWAVVNKLAKRVEGRWSRVESLQEVLS